MDLKPPPLTVPATPSYPPRTAHPMKPAPSPAYYLPIPAAPSYSVPSPSAVPAYPRVPASSPPLPTPATSPVSYPPAPASPEPYPSPPDHKGIKGAYWPSFDGFEASSIDTSYFTTFSMLKEWHEALVHEASPSGKPRLLLTAAVYYSSQFTTYGLPRSYPADSINKYVDWINPMCYDYHGTWENFTGPNAALYDPKSNVSTSFGIGSWIQAGVSPKKLVMGLPLYGRTWKLLDPNVNGIGARAVGKGPEDGILDYYQVLEFNKENNAIVNFDGQTVSYYSYAGGFWVGYDDSITIDWKVQFARSRGLGGYFFWALGQDKDWIISKQGKDT
ncbi:hypothetical protein H0E87_011688 [Populus deltoides]|uniref:GH18 domain-containing protein n=1 Tax=Populus deltoides TaxID=3696 RepID=A0A8T2YGG2_POPDE|nr:hypothetical protein H0E87_011688 [Populus deltoides]